MALGNILGGLFGGGGSQDFDTEIIQPTIPELPLQAGLVQNAESVLQANNPFIQNPFRALDYFQNLGVPQNLSPQFNGQLPAFPTGGTNFLGDFTNSPLSPISQLSQLLGQAPQGQPLPQQAGIAGQPQAPGVGGTPTLQPGQAPWNSYIPPAGIGGASPVGSVVGAQNFGDLSSGGLGAAPQGSIVPRTTLNAGDPNPLGAEGSTIQSSPGAPSDQLSQEFLPDIFAQPFIQGTQNALNVGNFASQALPQAAAFQQGLFGPGLTQQEQSYLGAAAQLGSRNLIDTQNRIEGQFETGASHGSLAPALFDAANQLNQQLNQTAGQLGTQRQSLAASTLPFTFGFPLQADQAAQQGAEGLFGAAQNAKFGEQNFPLSVFGSIPFAAPTIVSTPS